MKSAKNLMLGLMKTETRALIVGAGTLIAGVLLGVSGFIDGDVLLILAGSALTLVSLYVTVSAFIRYQWENVIDDARMYHEMAKIAVADYLEEQERRKHDKS